MTLTHSSEIHVVSHSPVFPDFDIFLIDNFVSGPLWLPAFELNWPPCGGKKDLLYVPFAHQKPLYDYDSKASNSTLRLGLVFRKGIFLSLKFKIGEAWNVN